MTANDQAAANQFLQRCIEFLDESVTPFHAVQAMASRLEAAGFQALNEADAWQMSAGNKYYVCRNDSSIIAFVYGEADPLEHGVRMLGAHTDSPCLKVKPQPDLHQHGYAQLGVEVYGGVLLNPWFDRDLSLAGRVSFSDQNQQLQSALVDFKRPVATIPSLAIHLDRGVNDKRSVNPQTDMPPLLGLSEEPMAFQQLLRDELLKQQPDLDIDQILDFEISCYDCQGAGHIGLNGDFLASARLDNLLSCFIGLESLLIADGEQSCLLVCNDHEEVGSASACGAQGPMLASFLERVWPDITPREQLINRSVMISADNAHGIHPNFPNKHDGNHGPKLNAGPVIKINANQRYASNSETSGLFKLLAEELPVQTFVTRADMGCGSTIGPITATEIGVRTVDVGVPTFGMHSIRELAGSEDCYTMHQIFNRFLARQRV
ncbi:M18 family aminopeptidase [Pseudoteredinibacter isoporae]|uniref:M18 family aminopeptidase n=1 Tax=Pseudoteredinibacter isoporae TaxID=570281 RepID=A0A7X0MZ32_9GAMM|nr:M18 family aminopeptidase [Pseudoteredinibacter isoporae]MBB6523729.1 aspartyl aminopeptidase [Pseudoteredinibacter isoporae]NHO89231.1 M18 family aminopeptidase [Pseudoteredinibacter isoporae]NIB22158.1 M18 family aminopeptidase [Pseudoteredinibacter isoporae]